MSDISGIGPVGGVPEIPAKGPEPVSPAKPSLPGADEVRLSPQASQALELLNSLQNVPEARIDRVNDLRALIAQGHYPTDEAVRVAVDRFIAEELQ